jgi:hypothetical protein
MKIGTCSTNDEGMPMLIMLLLATVVPAPPAGLLPFALDPNPGLRSYVANATLVARAHPIPLARTFTGVAYYARPTRKIVFDTVPRALSAFKTLETTIPTYAQATADYAIAPVGDDGKTSTFSLMPKVAGRVAGLMVRVDDTARLIMHAVWTYRDGSTLTVDEHYAPGGPFRLQSSIDVQARFHGYSVDGTIRLTAYRTNVDIPQSVFNASP